MLLTVPVELTDGDPVEDAERLLLSEELPELLREALSVPEPEDVLLEVILGL